MNIIKRRNNFLDGGNTVSWEALNNRKQTNENCYCFGGQCQYFSSIDQIKLSWQDSKQFCKCLGGELVEILDNGLMNSLSFYTLGLNDGLKKIETGSIPTSATKSTDCYQHLDCLQRNVVSDDLGNNIQQDDAERCSVSSTGACDKKIFWVNQVTTDDKCAVLAAWRQMKFWLPCTSKVNFVCSTITNHADCLSAIVNRIKVFVSVCLMLLFTL